MSPAALQTTSRAARLLFATVGGYAFAAGFMGLLSACLLALGMVASEAANMAILVGNLVFVGVAIWVVASKRPWHTVVIVAVGAAGMIAGAPMLVGS